MKPPDLTEGERDELTVLAMLEILERFGEPVRLLGKLIPWPAKEAPAEARAVPKS
jgi:hypothetical protein